MVQVPFFERVAVFSKDTGWSGIWRGPALVSM